MHFAINAFSPDHLPSSSGYCNPGNDIPPMPPGNNNNNNNPAFILCQLCAVPAAAQLDAAALAKLLQAAMDTFPRHFQDTLLVSCSGCISRLCSLPGAAQLAADTVHGLLK